MHLEPLDKTVDIAKGASHETVVKTVEGLGWDIFAPKTKAKIAARPRKARRSKLAATQPAVTAQAAPAAKPTTKTKAAAKPKAPAAMKA